MAKTSKEPWERVSARKREQIVDMFMWGHNRTEISKILGLNSKIIYSVLKKAGKVK